LNTLTGAGVLAEDKLFATLDTRSRRLRLPDGTTVVLTDTVGFIRDMPRDLFAAFRATFEEAADADLILEVVDASSRELDAHAEATRKVLEELGLAHIPRLTVRNKLDLLDRELDERPQDDDDSVGVSAIDKTTTEGLLERIGQRLAQAPSPALARD
jgi:GTP-binding protein HflX